MKIDLTQAAERDLIEIYLYGIAQFGAAQAEEYTANLAQKMGLMAANPSFGADYGFVQRGLRRGEYISHAIYYRPNENGILVLRILHGRMDIGKQLQ